MLQNIFTNIVTGEFSLEFYDTKLRTLNRNGMPVNEMSDTHQEWHTCNEMPDTAEEWHACE